MLSIARIIALLFLVSAAIAQTNKVLITEHVHAHEANDPLQFDLSLYFNDTEWLNAIGEETRSLIGKKFQTMEVEYLHGFGPRYLFPSGESMANSEADGAYKSDFLATLISKVRLSGSQSYSAWGPNHINYVFELKVDINNPNGKKAFRESVRIPFRASAEDYLYGPLISEPEYKSMYQDALKAVFSGAGKLEKRFVKYGKHPAYEGFMAESNANTLFNKPTGRMNADRFIKGIFVLTDGAKNVIGQIDIDASEPSPEFTEIVNLNLTNRLKMTSSLANSITKEKSTVVAGLNTTLDFQFENKDLHIPRLTITDEQGKQSGKFELINPGKLTGEYAGKNYAVNISNILNLYELIEGQDLQGVIQFGPYTKENGAAHKDIVFFKKGLENEAIGRLIDLYFFARIATVISNTAMAEESEK
jgi:hypothetical protein